MKGSNRQQGVIAKTLVWLVFFCVSAIASADPDYLLIDDFFAQNPQQRTLTEQLRRQVEQPAQPIETQHRRPIRIAVVYPAQQTSDYWRRSVEAFTQRLDALKINYQLHTYYSRPLDDATQVQEQLLEALQRDPNYLIFTLDSDAHRRIIERLLVKGRPKLILQNITTPVRAWQGSQPLLYTGFDHQQGTRMLADTLFSGKLAQPRNVSIIFRDRGYVSRMRGLPFIDALRQRGVNPVSSYYTRSDEASAYEAALDALTNNPQIDLFYACSTDTAFGVARALKERGLSSKVLVNGWGGGREELAAIDTGQLDFTVVRLNEESSIAMAEAIKNDLRGDPVPLVYNGRMEILTRHDSPEYRRDLRARAFPNSGPQ